MTSKDELGPINPPEPLELSRRQLIEVGVGGLASSILLGFHLGASAASHQIKKNRHDDTVDRLVDKND